MSIRKSIYRLAVLTLTAWATAPIKLMRKSRRHITAALVVFLLGFGLPAKAQDVLIVVSGFDFINNDVQAKIMGTGSFTSVDIFHARLGPFDGTPTLAQLQAYDAVFVWAGLSFDDPNALGDVLADYVDGGGTVVQAMFTFGAALLSGRWRDQNYAVWQPAGDNQGTVLTLGTIHQPGHAILAGVASFNGGSNSFHHTVTTLNPGAAAIADWSNGRPLIAENNNSFSGCVVGLNFYPPSSDTFSPNAGWDVNTDGDLLMANALLFCGEVDIDIDIDIDIKPGSFPNSINIGSGGTTTVAILGSADFDVTTINADLLTLGTAGVKTVGKTARTLCSVADVSGDFSAGLEGTPDSFNDLVCHFITMDIVPEEGATTATISGELNDGTAIEGQDSVNIVP